MEQHFFLPHGTGLISDFRSPFRSQKT